MFPDRSLSHVKLFGGHVVGLHANDSKDFKSKKPVDQSFISRTIDYPQLETVLYEHSDKKEDIPRIVS